MATRCQLKLMPEAGENLSVADNLVIRSQEKFAWLHRMGRIAIADPSRLVQKLARIRRVGGSVGESSPDQPETPARATDPVWLPAALGLRPGEVVRVKSLEGIEATLDTEGRCQGLAFMNGMADHCLRSHVVAKRVRRFFDERTRRLLKLRNVVILEDVYCEPPRGDFHDYAGCDRTCFFFWKEAWLERVKGNGG